MTRASSPHTYTLILPSFSMLPSIVIPQWKENEKADKYLKPEFNKEKTVNFC